MLSAHYPPVTRRTQWRTIGNHCDGSGGHSGRGLLFPYVDYWGCEPWSGGGMCAACCHGGTCGSGITGRSVETSEGLVIISPCRTEGDAHTSLVNHAAAWSIEGTGIVIHDAVDRRTPYAFEVGVGTFIA